MARTMPQNKDAEMSVLGLCFLDNNLIGKILEEVNSDMFYNDANKKIYEAIKKMYENHIALDITTITEELDKSKNLAAVGGIEYLTDVIDSVVTASNIDYYISDIDFSTELNEDDIDLYDGVRAEVYANLFSYAIGEDDNNKAKFVNNFINSFKVVQKDIKKYISK